jgi:hypothetical protein
MSVEMIAKISHESADETIIFDLSSVKFSAKSFKHNNF